MKIRRYYCAWCGKDEHFNCAQSTRQGSVAYECTCTCKYNSVNAKSHKKESEADLEERWQNL